MTSLSVCMSTVECSREEFGVEMKEFEKEMMRNSHLFPNDILSLIFLPGSVHK